jgi:hypothetical protein
LEQEQVSKQPAKQKEEYNIQNGSQDLHKLLLVYYMPDGCEVAQLGFNACGSCPGAEGIAGTAYPSLG